MAVWFLSWHEGAVDWARERGIFEIPSEIRAVSEIVIEQVSLGDIVIGTLPVHFVADICARGARYMHVSMQVPAGRRGTELSASEMTEFGAKCREFLVFAAGDELGSTTTQCSVPAAGEGVHVCIVSEQHMANLLPILKRKPAYVALVCTPEVIRAAGGRDRLVNALSRFGYDKTRISSHVIAAEASAAFATARQVARGLRETFLEKYPTQPLTLNATGGTKILSSAFFLEFQGVEIIYTDSQQGNNCIRFMSDQVREPESMGAQIVRIGDYLHCQGYKVEKVASDSGDFLAIAKSRIETTKLLAKNGGSYTLSILNDAARKFESEILGRKRKSDVEKTRLLDAGLRKMFIPGLKPEPLVEKLCEAKFLNKVEDGKFVFAGAEAMCYLSGGWLEEWAWDVALSCGADDCAINVTVSYRDQNEGGTNPDESDNELDLVVLYNNRLLIAECKTIMWKGASAKQEIFNKLDALGTHARGLFGKSILVSAKPLDDKAARRAKAYGITVVQGWSLDKLKGEISRWMGKP